MTSPQRIDFAHVIEGQFLRGLRDEMTDELRIKLKDDGLDLSRLEVGYPAEFTARWVRLAAETLHPGLPIDRSVNLMGRAFFRGYTDTFIGKALVAVMKLIGPKRTLERMQRNFRSGNNYIETSFRDVGQRHAEVWFNITNGIPSYYQGILEEGSKVVGAVNPQVTYLEDASGGATYTVTWG